MRNKFSSALLQMSRVIKMKNNLWIIFCLCLIFAIPAQSQIVGQKVQISLNTDNSFQKNVEIQVSQQKVKQFLVSQGSKQNENWFIFFDIEPSDEVSWPDIYVSISTQNMKDKTKVTHKKQCGKQGLQLETCYISNEEFDLKQEILIVTISCDEEVKMLLFTEFILVKKMQLNSCNKIDSSPIKRDSKMFKINIKQIAVKFQQIRISLTPINKIYGGEALHLYGSFGKYFPTPYNHDFSSFYAWQMGVLIRLLEEQLVEVDEIYILADYPQNYLFDLDTTLIEDYIKPIQLKTGQFYDDVMAGLVDEKKFILTIQHPELNNYIRIKKYYGYIDIEKIEVLQYEKAAQKIQVQNFVTKHKSELFMSSQEFKISRGIKKLQISLISRSVFQGVIYTIQTYQNSKDYNWIADGQAHLAELAQDQKIYFVSRAIRHENQTSAVSQAQIKIATKQGKVIERIFVCLVDEVDKCFDVIKNSSSSEKVKKDGLVLELQGFKVVEDNFLNKKQIDLTLGKDKFINYTDGYQQQLILVEMTGDKNIKENVFSIEFMNVGIIDTLAEHQTKTQKLQAKEFKIYRFTVPSDKEIHGLTFHVTNLYGSIQRFTSDADPSWKTEQQLKKMLIAQRRHYVRQYENNVEIDKVEPSKTYYLVIFAKNRAMYSIRVQLKKYVSHPDDERNISYSNFLVNTLSSYQLTFTPEQLIILNFDQITTPLILMRASALLPLDFCINLHHSQQKNELPLEPNCEFRHKIGKKYEIYLNLQVTQRQFGLYNGNNKTVTLSLSLQSHQKCLVRRLGEKQFFQARMFSELNTKQLCIKFKLYKKGSLIVSYKPKSPIHHKSLTLSFAIGRNQNRLLSRYETIIDAQEVSFGCEQNYEDCYVSLIGKLSEQDKETVASMTDEELIFQVQYVDEPIDLIDGVPFTYMGPLTSQQPLRFKFPIYSISDPIRLVLEKQIGYFKVLAKLVNTNEHFFYPQLTDVKQKITGNNSELSTIYQASNSMFYLYDIMKIPEQQLKKHCSPNLEIDHYRACTLLISVFPTDDKNILISEHKFTIEAVQHVSTLKQFQPVPGYLQPEMINFYQIQNGIQNSTVIIYVNGNSKESKDLLCLQMAARFGIADFAKDQYTYRTRKGQHQIVIPNAKKGTYTLLLKGVQSSQKYCDFMLQYSVIPPTKKGEKQTEIAPIMSLKKSTPFKIEMTENQTEYFMFFNHGKNANFKVLTLFEKLGEVLISVMPFPTNDDQRNLITNIKKIDTFFKPQWKDSNSVEIYAKDKAYCGQCLYLIKIECLKSIKGSIIVPEQHQQVSIGQNILVYDQLLKGQKSYYRLYASFKFSINMKLISGAVSIKVINREDNQTMLDKKYTATKEEIVANIELKKNSTYEYYIDWLVEIDSQDDTHFVLSFKDVKKEDQQKNMTRELILGVPLSVLIVPTINQCVTGVMEEQPTFIISSFSTFILTPNGTEGLQFQFWVKNNSTNDKTLIPKQSLESDKTLSSVLLKVKQSQNTAKLFDSQNTFELCFSTTQVSSFDIIQSSHVNFLPPNSQILVNKNVNFTFMAGEDNILQINECKGNSWISISQSFGAVHTLESEITQIRRPNSLIEFQNQGPIFLSVESDGIMSISWKQVDLLKGINTGYSIYQSGSFKVLPVSDSKKNLQLQILPLKESTLSIIPKERFPLINSLRYEIYIEKQQTHLNEAMNCHKSLGIKKQLQVRFDDDFNKKQTVEIQSINELKSKFTNSEYVLVSVKAFLQLKNKVTGQVQKYRFFYPYQEVILSEKQLRSVTGSDKDSNRLLYFFIGMLFAVILIVTLIFFCGRKIRNYLDKIRRKRIMQENHFQLKSQISSQTDKYYQKAMDP